MCIIYHLTIAILSVCAHRPRMVLSSPRSVCVHHVCWHPPSSARLYGSLLPSRLMDGPHGGCKYDIHTFYIGVGAIVRSSFVTLGTWGSVRWIFVAGLPTLMYGICCLAIPYVHFCYMPTYSHIKDLFTTGTSPAWAVGVKCSYIFLLFISSVWHTSWGCLSCNHHINQSQVCYVTIFNHPSVMILRKAHNNKPWDYISGTCTVHAIWVGNTAWETDWEPYIVMCLIIQPLRILHPVHGNMITTIPSCGVYPSQAIWFSLEFHNWCGFVTVYSFVVLFYHSPLQRKVIWKPRQNGRLLYHHAGYHRHQAADSEWIHTWLHAYSHTLCFVSKRLHNVLIGSRLIVSLLECVKLWTCPYSTPISDLGSMWAFVVFDEVMCWFLSIYYGNLMHMMHGSIIPNIVMLRQMALFQYGMMSYAKLGPYESW